MQTTITKNEMLIEKIGPVCVVMDHPGENFATFQVCHNQASIVVLRDDEWAIDGFARMPPSDRYQRRLRRYWEDLPRLSPPSHGDRDRPVRGRVPPRRMRHIVVRGLQPVVWIQRDIDGSTSVIYTLNRGL